MTSGFDSRRIHEGAAGQLTVPWVALIRRAGSSPARSTIVLLAFLALPFTAAAQSSAAVHDWLLAAAARYDCKLHDDHRIVYRGRIEGLAESVAVVQYGVVGCGGGNNSSATFAVLRGERGRLVALPQPNDVMNVVLDVGVQNERIVLQGFDYTPDDPRCCPSVERRQELVVEGGRLVVQR